MENSKYQETDNLYEDPVLPYQMYCLISYANPETIKNCKIRAFNCRGFAPSYEDAIILKDELIKKDPIHKIYIQSVGKWGVKNTEEEVILNELAGRRKEYLINSKKTHKDRIKNSIKSGVQGKTYEDDLTKELNKGESTEHNNLPETKIMEPKENDFFSFSISVRDDISL